MKYFFIILIFLSANCFAQKKKATPAMKRADSLFNRSVRQKIKNDSTKKRDSIIAVLKKGAQMKGSFLMQPQPAPKNSQLVVMQIRDSVRQDSVRKRKKK